MVFVGSTLTRSGELPKLRTDPGGLLSLGGLMASWRCGSGFRYVSWHEWQLDST